VTSEPNVKGVGIRSVLGSIERLCPPGTLDAVVPLLDESLGRMVSHRTFISSGWYPLRDYRALLGAVMQATGRDLELIQLLAREATLEDFRGIYRLLTFALSPEFLIRRSPGLFARYYDTGKLAVPIAKKGYVEAQFRGCAGFDRVLWADAVAGSCAVLEACGARDVRPRIVHGGGDGDGDLDLIAEWR
jgi:hypothetical protein